MFCQASLGRVEDDVFLMNSAQSRCKRPRPELLQETPESLYVFNLQLNFGFARHIYSPVLPAYFHLLSTSVSIAKVSRSILRGRLLALRVSTRIDRGLFDNKESCEPRIRQDIASGLRRVCAGFKPRAAPSTARTGRAHPSRRPPRRPLRLAPPKGRPGSPALPRGRERLYGRRSQAYPGYSGKALPGNAWPHPADRSIGPLPLAWLSLLHENRRRQAVSLLFSQAR